MPPNLKKVAYAATRQSAERRKGEFQRWARGEGLKPAAGLLDKKVQNATAVIWKMLLVAETKFRKLNS